MIDITLKCVLFHNYVKQLGLSGWKHIAIHQIFFFFIFFLRYLDTVLHFCLINCQPHCKMLIPSDKHEGKLILPSFNLSLCHVFVKGRSMHIIDIPVACCMTHPSTPLSITHFLYSISPEAESNRPHQTGWSEQNCDWQCPADSPWNSVKPGECTWMRMWTVCAFLCLHLLVYMCTYMHWFLIACMQACQCIYLPVCVCASICMWVCFCTSPLSWASLRWRGGGGWRVRRSSLQHGVQRELWAPQVWITGAGGKKMSLLSKFFKIIQHIYIKQMYAQ